VSKFSKRLKQSWKCLFHGLPPVIPAAEPIDIFKLLNFAWAGQAIFVATKIGVLDQLVQGPKSVTDLARLTNADEACLQQVLQALAGCDLLSRDESGRYSFTPLSESLADKTSWLRRYVMNWGEQYYPAAGNMLEIVKSGRSGFELTHGEASWSSIYSRPDDAKLFIDYMSSVTDMQSSAICGAFDFTPYRQIVDVGGGRASLISAVLRANPHLIGTIVDLPSMKEEAGERIKSEQLADRCTFAGGSFLESVPASGDVYMIKHVLHDWPDSDVIKILRNICTAMNENSRLIIVEGVINDLNGADCVLKLQDLERMFLTGGKGRSQGEFGALLELAGLRLEEIRHTAVMDCSLIIVRKK